MSQFNYYPTPNPAQPGVAQSPFAGWYWNPEGSIYQGLYPTNKETTDLLRKTISQKIVDGIPPKYKLMQFFYNMGVSYEADDEYYWKEQSWNRVAIYATGDDGGGGATQTIVSNGIGASGNVGLQAKISYPDGTKAIVTAINANTFVVQSQTGATLPAVVTGDKFTIDNYPKADGMNYTVGYSRLNLLTYSNVIEMFERSKRWTSLEQLKHQNVGVTDYMEQDKAMLMKEIYQDAFITFINGNYGEFTFTAPNGTGTYYAKTCNGMYPMMVNNGSQNGICSMATLPSTFETLAFNSNYQGTDEPRLVLCTSKMWYNISKILIDPVRFSPTDKKLDLNLELWKLGSMSFIPMIIDNFEDDANMFPGFENKIIVVDPKRIKPVCMRGREPFAQYESKMTLGNGGREDYNEWYAHAMISCKLETPAGHFWIDVTP